MSAQTMRERIAVALSMADPDERGLPHGWKMAPFYRMLADAVLAEMRFMTDAMFNAGSEVIDGHPEISVVQFWQAMIDAAMRKPADARFGEDLDD